MLRRLKIKYLIFFWGLLTIPFSDVYGQEQAGVNPCLLFSKIDAESILGEKVSDGKVIDDAVIFGAQGCNYSYIKEDFGVKAKYGIIVNIASSEALRQGGLYSSAKEAFVKRKNALLNSAYGKEKTKSVSGLADDAIWDGKILWFLKGDYYIWIKITKGRSTEQDIFELSKKSGDLLLKKIK